MKKRNNIGQFIKGSKSELIFVNLSTYTYVDSGGGGDGP